MKKMFKRAAALLLSLLLLLPLAQVPAAAKDAELRIALLSDPHYFPEEMAGGYGEVFDEGNIIGHPIEQAPGTFRSALASIKARAKKEGLQYLLIPGDLTREGEYEGHKAFARLLGQFEKDTGIPVAVVPGNHDINNGGAADFSSGEKEKARETTYDDFYEIYKNFGYDLPNLARYIPAGEDKAGQLSYAADLGGSYRLVAIDTRERRINPELQDWVMKQCKNAAAAGKAVVAMGHHNLDEQFGGQLRFMQNQDIEDMHEISERFADAGMHFYFSGHLHVGEISSWMSDKGEAFYDICVPGTYSFPGDYRTAKFTAGGGKIMADIRSYPLDEAQTVVANGITYPNPYYASNLGVSFGYGGEGLTGFVKANARRELTRALEDLAKSGGITALIKNKVDLGPLNLLFRYIDAQLSKNTKRIVGIVEDLVDEAFALPVSQLPCTRFIDTLGFGDPKKPGTMEDAGNSVMAYMFWKEHDVADDPFMQDVLRRMKNGELLDQVLNFALPKALEVLGGEGLPLFIPGKVVNWTLEAALNGLGCPLIMMPLLALVVTPGIRETISNTLYTVAGSIMASQSPTGRRDGVLVYNGPVKKDVPTGPDTFRLPYDARVSLSKDKKSAEITWYTKGSLSSPGLRLTGKDGSAAAGVDITYDTKLEEILVNEVDLAFMQMMGRKLQAAKHTARLENLDPRETYQFAAGDSEFGWWAQPQALDVKATPVTDFFMQAWQWLCGMWELMGITWRNRGFY